MSAPVRQLLTHLLASGRSFTRGFLHLLYPNTCWLCGACLPEDRRFFCGSCEKSIVDDPHFTCQRCSSTVGPHVSTAQGCNSCRTETFAFDRTFRLGPYDGNLRDAVLRMKHPAGEGLAEAVACLWAGRMASHVEAFHADVVIPVPLHWTRHWLRRYNQSQVLAQALADRLGRPCKPSWLRRIRRTPRQTGQTSPTARYANVRNAFRCRAGLDLSGKTVVLVDDVLTTGYTASEAARALRSAKAAHIIVAVVGHG